MNILIVGSGGREHALAWKLAQSPLASKVSVTPGNGGTLEKYPPLQVPVKAPYHELIEAIKKEKIELTIVGPEVYLMDGLADVLRKEGLLVFGPSMDGARIEGSKAFAKEIMNLAQVPTAKHQVFTDRSSAENYLKNKKAPYVLKADGLAAGKGVVIAESFEDATLALKDFFDHKKFGAAGTTLVIEDFLKGFEVSILALTDGKKVTLLPASQDHKRAYDGDKGPNTGGMGVYSPVPGLTEAHLKIVHEKVLLPTLKVLRDKKIDYRGTLYAGLMIDGEDVNVVEFNARFGDPETECVLPLVKNDLLEIMLACAKGELGNLDIQTKPESACTVIMASKGYPDTPEAGKTITGLSEVREAEAFHAGTKVQEGKIISSGGRVLAVTATAKSLKEAIAKSYQAVRTINFEGEFHRTDIGAKGLR